MPEAEVVRLGELVNFQGGAVVSRTLLKGPAGTVTVFAFDEGASRFKRETPYCFRRTKHTPSGPTRPSKYCS